jgi:hypothetical protein
MLHVRAMNNRDDPAVVIEAANRECLLPYQRNAGSRSRGVGMVAYAAVIVAMLAIVPGYDRWERRQHQR